MINDAGNKWVNGHNMRVNNKRTEITYDDLMIVGKKFNIKKRKVIFEQIKSVVDQFSKYAIKNNVKKELIKQVEENRPRIGIK